MKVSTALLKPAIIQTLSFRFLLFRILIAAIVILFISSCQKYQSGIAMPTKRDENAITAAKKNLMVRYNGEYYDSIVSLSKRSPNGIDLNLIPKWDPNRVLSGNTPIMHSSLSEEEGASVLAEDNTHYFETSTDVLFGGEQADGYNAYWNFDLWDFDNQQDYEAWVSAAIDGYLQTAYHGHFSIYGEFSGRNIAYHVIVPTKYYKIPVGVYGYKYKFLATDRPAQFQILGGALGQIQYGPVFNDFYPTNPTINSTGSLHGSATETRTKIMSVDGKSKFSADLNLAAFTAGGELGAGFTIQSATHSIGTYELEGDYRPLYVFGHQTRFSGSIKVSPLFAPGNWKD